MVVVAVLLVIISILPLLAAVEVAVGHQVVAPHAGVITEVFVQTGQQLDGGQPLLKVDPS